VSKTVAIIGAGASGLVAAITAARAGAKVKVYEKNNKIGKKILATGNGRCNITNQTITKGNYHGDNPSFVNPAINHFNTSTCRAFFSELGIEMTMGQNGRLYPKSLQSSSVVDLLAYECRRLGVEFLLETKIENIIKTEDGFSPQTKGRSQKAEKILICTGGPAMPTVGGCDSGYELAMNFNHTIKPVHPSLVQLVCSENLKNISGVKIQGDIEVFIDKELKINRQGDILFTNYGISGSAVLDISRIASHALLHQRDVRLKIDLFSDYSKEQLKNLLKKRLKFSNAKSVSLWLNGFINSKLALYFEKSLKIKEADKLNPKDIVTLVHFLKNMTLHVEDTRGFKSAEVTAGGINTKEINSQTLESKLQKGLFFAGEVLDIDGDCGGYNLHWAWASGYLAGSSM